ncbi:uncharacterized protein LAJ45_05082 [Morchella importuna]|uniref:uncharacterized protein n=1 Tax=Morchella importuna TaxID=1174673 RepID=UPI001E8D445F|nr:uncharacterized protein LAJ45_05082 [Morchella importuna]KAH8150900.1 hypothetical protein LAJ45_05082 [Morchella importuna]
MGPTTYTTLEINTSDGVDTVYPERTEKLVEPDGSYEYFRLVADDEPKAMLYLTKGANALMEEYGMIEKGVQYIFKTLPDNYRLYEHVKCHGGATPRRDTYLFGHPASKRFRSVNEFIPHLLYLAGKDKTCRCVYCSSTASKTGSTTIRRRTKREVEVSEARRTVAVEERQKEQETAGWVMRKGEIVWVWVSDNPEAEQDENDPLIDHDGGIWMAGIVAERPNYSPPLEKSKTVGGRGLFSDIELDDTSPWQEVGDGCYTIQLCSDTEPGQILENIKQCHVRPWLARLECCEVRNRAEHPTIPIARKMAETICLFDRQSEDVAFQGAFIGAEKIFLNEPVRITNDADHFEDVLVIEKVFKDDKFFMLKGIQYTAYPSKECTAITFEEFANLPFRMRRGSGSGEVIKWFRRNALGERVECSVGSVLGRWYEPQAVHAWTGSTGIERRALACIPSTVLTLRLMSKDQVTPERTFKSVNLRIPPATPGVSPTKEMEAKKEEVKEGQEVEMVEAQGEDDEEYEEEEESDELASQDDKYRRPGPEVLSQSPTKRRRR